ncbi:MAG TPA: flagellar hook-basal body complex protein FliE [Bryobacteraceae bacterium]|nr:flagellar hook-basal body complex protein FliE [Bryobacteraceae bacterium]
MTPISPINPAVIQPVKLPDAASSSGRSGGFSSMFADALQGVNQLQNAASASIDSFLSGENEEVHKVALATQRSEIAFDLFLQVRNKMVSAYQEVMRMQM